MRLLAALASGLLLPLVFVGVVSGNGRHVVEPGDTLTYLSQIYAVTIDEIVQLNGIVDPDRIFPGQALEIPGLHDADARADGSYTIQDGDTLGEIADRFDVTLGALQAANNITDPALIISGHTLVIPGGAPPETVYEPPPPLAFPDRPYDDQIEALIEEFAGAYGVDARTVKALATIESGWNQFALSHAGAQGVMQIMPGTAEWLEAAVFGYALNEDTSAYDNIKMGVRYLSLLLDSTQGNERLAVAAYYQGLAPTESGVFYPDTADYVQMIFRVRDAYWP
jgi:LysM repeat protein